MQCKQFGSYYKQNYVIYIENVFAISKISKIFYEYRMGLRFNLSRIQPSLKYKPRNIKVIPPNFKELRQYEKQKRL